MPKSAVGDVAVQEPETMWLRFQGVSASVELNGAADLLPAIEDVFMGWPWKRLKRQPRVPVAISFTKHGEKYLRHSKWVETPDLDDDATDAMCDFVSDIIDAYVEERPGMLGIHASAVRIGDGLIVIPSTHRSGKSLLCAHLVARGGVLFSDDVLLLPPRGFQGIATGIVPRLRLPVPDENNSPLPTFISQNGIYANERYGWLKLPSGQMAKLGDRAPVRAIVLLNRKKKKVDRMPRLDAISRPDALARLIRRGFALDAKADDVLSRFSRIASTADCYRLKYGSATKAADHLWQTFN